MATIQPFAIEPFAKLDIKCVDLLPTDVPQPQWLCALAEAADASNDPLRILCAVGTISRLADESREYIAAKLADLLSGKGSNEPDILWAAALTDAQRSTLLDLVRVACDSLIDEMEHIIDRVEAGHRVAMSRAATLEIFHKRDDLEGARVMLAVASGSCGFADHLQIVDGMWGKRFQACAQRVWHDYPEEMPQSERLDKSGVMDWGDWWIPRTALESLHLLAPMDEHMCVYQIRRDRYRQFLIEGGGIPASGQDMPIFPVEYELVALVPGEEVERAFQLTNHISTEWWDNPEVDLIGEPDHRSTSVGDVVVMPDGSFLRCEGRGWTNIAAVT